MKNEEFQIQRIKKCPECNGNVILTSHEQVCKECGLIIDQLYVETSYLFDNHLSNNTLNKQYVALGERTDFVGGLGTFIDYESSKYLKDTSGRLLPPNEQTLYRRLKKNYAQFLRIKNHETEYRIFNILNKITTYLNLNKNIRNNAAYYYKKIIKKEKRVINNISLIGFCIFYAAREELHNAPINITELSEAFQNFGHRVNPRLILRDGLKYKIHLKKNATPHTSEDYLIRLIDQVINHKDLDSRLESKGCLWDKSEYRMKLINKSQKILRQLSSWDRGGRNPFILTGAIIYLADKLLAEKNRYKSILTQKLISDSTKIAEYSIRDHYVNLLKPLFKKH
ncbi:MAG: hypothetical protein ACFE8E_07395 [Candidatus Hodarchaeota archaeon]